MNLLIKALGTVLGAIIGLLPSSPFQTISNSAVTEYLGMLNWFISVDAMITILTYWTTAIISYYVISTAMRWGKTIE
ncbi:hypothetical protein TZ02_17750 [Clostridium aceticum]|nr:hypothetical protein TZ02_17750 [Clostridium aceticum]